jgi:hypothetical protein
MSTLFAILFGVASIGLLTGFIIFYTKSQKLEQLLSKAQADIAASKTEVARVRAEAEQGVTEAQQLIDQQIEDLNAEKERIQQHFEAEARKAAEAAQAEIAKAQNSTAELQKYAALRDAEEEVRRVLATAMDEATALRGQAQALMDQARSAAERERLLATEKARTIYEQADARLNQATRDAGRIVTNAEMNAKEIAGEAYDALRDKQLLERASVAMRNIIEGYGDKYLIPTHSLLDELAAEFGYTSAGESLKSARAQSRRMVEQGEAASCDYVETGRKVTAIHFVIDAFNGRVDAILSRVKHDNFGVLEQEIRDAFSLVNLHGKAFRDAQILHAYLDARLAELKWAVVAQELKRKQLEEQRDLKARLRDEAKALKEREEQMRLAAKEEELKMKVLEDKERELAEAKLQFDRAAADDKAKWEQKIAEMQTANIGLRQDLAAATERKLTIAQQTKRGHVYVISNIGTFGEGVYKIGQTRRLDPQERIDELSDASVPFDFDIHALIECDNAPVLEHTIQKRFLSMQLNKVNSRKEFFRVSLQDIRQEIDKLPLGEGIVVKQWTDLATAVQYRESLDIESNPEKLGKWLKRQEALADRELRMDTLHLTFADTSAPETVSTTP